MESYNILKPLIVQLIKSKLEFQEIYMKSSGMVSFQELLLIE